MAFFGLDLTGTLAALGIGDVGTYLVATLPSASTNARRTAWVTDLFSDLVTPGGRVVSEGGYWKPIRPLALASVASGNMTLTALQNSPTQVLTGTIGTGVTHNITFSLTGAYPGARFRTKRLATGLGSMLINGLALPLNNWVDHEFDPVSNAWVETASGGLL